MIYIDLLDICDLSKSCNLAVYTVKFSACFELTLPRVFVISCHIIVGMIACYYHQWTKYYFLVSCFFHCFNHCFACGLFRFSFYSSDEDILISKIIHLCLHLAVTYLCSMGCSMAHEYECGSIFFCCVQIIISCFCYSCCCNGFCYFFFIIVDCFCIISNFSQKWLSDHYRIKLIFVFFYCLCQFIIFCSVHQMCWLYYQVLYAVVYCTVQSLLHIVDTFIISRFYMVDDDLCSKGSSYRPVWVCICKGFFDSSDISHTAVIEGCTEADYQQFVFTDFIFI